MKSSASIWHLLHTVKSTVKISSIFTVFLENMNFTKNVFLHLQILTIDLDLADSKHIESVYEKKKPFKCEICVYSCFIKQNMDRHVESVHEE